MNDPRGSIWRKWDLHIHSPLSAHNNLYPKEEGGNPDWEQFIAKLESLPDIDVIGITDYLSVEGYGIVRDFKERNRLKNIKTLLANVEFRVTPVTKKGDEINLHLIFSDELSVEQIEKFLRTLKYNYKEIPYYIDKGDLIKLGKAIKSGESIDDRDAFKEGVEKFNIHYTEIKKAIEDNREIEEKVLVAVSNSNIDGASGIQESSMIATRQELYSFADIILSSNPNDKKYFLGKSESDSPDTIIAKYRRLKPCIHGSDAHNLDQISIPCTKRSDSTHNCITNKDQCNLRHTWIKANPTFDGLRQVIYEPEDRVYIGNRISSSKDNSKIIESITINNPHGWFDNNIIKLNRDMVSIIGGKGAGKTALADIIAIAGGHFKDENDESFLSKASEFITGTNIKITWEDGEEHEHEIDESLAPYNEQLVTYLSQKYVEKLCSHAEESNLLSVIESIIFQYIPTEERLGFSTFDLLKQKRIEPVSIKTNSCISKINDLSRKIIEIREDIKKTEDRKNTINNLEKELKKLEKQKPKQTIGTNRSAQEQIEKLEEEKKLLSENLGVLNTKLLTVEKLDARASKFKEDVEKFNANIEIELKKIEELGFLNDFQYTNFPRTIYAIKSIREAAQKTLEAENSKMAALNEKIHTLTEKISGANKEEKALQAFKKKIASHKEQIKALKGEVAHVEDQSKPELEKSTKERRREYEDYFNNLRQEKLKLEDLYKPLADNLKSGDENENKITFEATINFKINDFIEHIDSILNNKSCSIDQDTLNKTSVEFCAKLNTNTPLTSLITNFLDKIEQCITLKNEKELILKSRYSKMDYEQWLFSTDFFTVQYGIKYNNTELKKLSPGQRGIVLLLMFLTMYKEDDRPLIIDQPEENLDNRAIYSSLVKYFKQAKQKRQIIIVTHNPNLVVNTDSEQIIVANFEPDRATQSVVIKYISGALESSFKKSTANSILDKQGIREHVCDILEGGRIAFEKRENKYALHLANPTS